MKSLIWCSNTSIFFRVLAWISTTASCWQLPASHAKQVILNWVQILLSAVAFLCQSLWNHRVYIIYCLQWFHCKPLKVSADDWSNGSEGEMCWREEISSWSWDVWRLYVFCVWVLWKWGEFEISSMFYLTYVVSIWKVVKVVIKQEGKLRNVWS